jgi:hypothetical protein
MGLVVSSRALQSLYGIALEFVVLEGESEETRSILQVHGSLRGERWTWRAPLDSTHRVPVNVFELARQSNNALVDERDPVREELPRLIRIQHRLVNPDEVAIARTDSQTHAFDLVQ